MGLGGAGVPPAGLSHSGTPKTAGGTPALPKPLDHLKYWLPAVIWACLISGLSTDTFSSEHTSVFIIPVLRWLFPHASHETIDLMHVVIRKMAHLTEYYILSVFLMHGLRGKDGEWKLRWAVWAVVIAAGYASFDEFHQSFVPSRTASPWDALLDTLGASTAQVYLWVWHFLRARNSKTNTIRRGDSFRW
jgi:VanZ family protein